MSIPFVVISFETYRLYCGFVIGDSDLRVVVGSSMTTNSSYFLFDVDNMYIFFIVSFFIVLTMYILCGLIWLEFYVSLCGVDRCGYLGLESCDIHVNFNSSIVHTTRV